MCRIRLPINRPKPAQILPEDFRGGRRNHWIFNRVNYANSNHAIARRIGCSEATVRYHRALRGIAPKQRGGRHPENYRDFTHTQRRWLGVEPLPVKKIIL